MWDAIDDIDPDADLATLTGDQVIVFFDPACELNRSAREQVERRAVRMCGARDLQFVFAPLDTHPALHEQCGLDSLPAAIFFEEGVEQERCHSIDDVIELVEELIASRK